MATCIRFDDKEKTILPFEEPREKSTPSTSTSKKAADYGNKRVEVFVNAEVAPDVLSAIGRLNLEATLYDSKGLGKEKQMVRGGRGTIESQATYSTRRTIVTIDI